MKMIGRYRVVAKLGQGGMGAVYKVAMPVTGKIAALKLLDPFDALLAVLGPERLQELFTAEAITMANLNHPRIAEVWDFAEDRRGRPFFIMEYYPNNLGQLIGEEYRLERRSRIIAPEKTIHYGGQLLDGLACLHHAGIIHRDIKPYNVLITHQDRVKICDFGMSLRRGEPAPRLERMQVGSPYYAAPEQAVAPEGVDHRADLYSAGVLLYRLLTGELPSMKNFSLSLVNSLYDQSWDDFFAKALSLRPDYRFQSAKEMGQALAALHLAWQQRRDDSCQLQIAAAPIAPPTGQLRSHPLQVARRQCRAIFAIDRLGRPRRYHQPSWQPNPDGTAGELNSGLLWQEAGSDYPLTWLQAKSYILSLNQSRFAGKNNWRLPTVNELLSLLPEVTAPTSYCQPSPLAAEQRLLWSSDHRDPKRAWYVHLEMGFTGELDCNALAFVRAVSDLHLN